MEAAVPNVKPEAADLSEDEDTTGTEVDPKLKPGVDGLLEVAVGAEASVDPNVSPGAAGLSKDEVATGVKVDPKLKPGSIFPAVVVVEGAAVELESNEPPVVDLSKDGAGAEDAPNEYPPALGFSVVAEAALPKVKPFSLSGAFAEGAAAPNNGAAFSVSGFVIFVAGAGEAAAAEATTTGAVVESEAGLPNENTGIAPGLTGEVPKVRAGDAVAGSFFSVDALGMLKENEGVAGVSLEVDGASLV